MSQVTRMEESIECPQLSVGIIFKVTLLRVATNFGVACWRFLVRFFFPRFAVNRLDLKRLE